LPRAKRAGASAIIFAVRVLVLWLVISLGGALSAGGCATGGSYARADREGDFERSGETNGRMLDFVSNLPEGDDWQIRVRDDSLWVAHGDGEQSNELGAARLAKKEAARLWELIDAVEIPDRKKGKKDPDEGWVQLRLREPGDDSHDIHTIYISRLDAEDDEEVLALAAYLQDLVQKHFKKKLEF
jgi:hypothetical protein